MASRNNDLVRKLSKLYNAYTAIDDDRALRRSGMTLAEYNALPDVFTRLQNDGRAETFMSGLANYFQKFGFNVSEGNGVNFVITASSSIGRRRITASTSRKDVIEEFRRFIDDLQYDLQDNENRNFELKGSYIDDDGEMSFEIEPRIYGEGGDPLDTLTIDYDYTTGNITAYCAENDDVVADGRSFRDIRSNCYNWLKETLIMMYEDMPDEY